MAGIPQFERVLALLAQAEQELLNGGERLDWEQYGVVLARATGLRADCTRRRVGAVIFDTHHRVLSLGYNGYPSGAPGCLSSGACPRGRLSSAEVPPGTPYVGVGVTVVCAAIHAEENALLASDPLRRRGGMMAVSDLPCPNCQRLAAGSGLARVVWPEGEVLFQ